MLRNWGVFGGVSCCALATTWWVAIGTLTGAESAESKQPEARTSLGIAEGKFTLNAQPAFLLGISYYGGLGAPVEFIRRDLDDLQGHGFNWVRIWATWNAFDQDLSAVDRRGGPREPFLGRLEAFILECDRRKLIVDVTLTRGAKTLPDFEAHKRAVETLVNALKARSNWYLDLANEHDVRDGRYVPPQELKILRESVRRLDTSRLVTASSGGHDLNEQEVREALLTIGLDFLSPHRPRAPGSPSHTEEKTRACLDWMRSLGRVAPVHYQEPFRRGYAAWQPAAADFLVDLRGAVAGGAAGWCFHNGAQRGAPDAQPRRSFDLTSKRLFDQLDDAEREVVSQVAGVLRER
jgi:hypothetical protein